MPDISKSTGRRLRTGWFWPLVLLALPMCTNDFDGLRVGDERDPDPIPAFEPGSDPTSAILCDIPKPLEEDEDECATDAEVNAGDWVAYAAAAVDLNLGEKNLLVLDFSDGATSGCAGQPKKIRFHKLFPDGYPVCLNCGTQLPDPYPDFTAVCIAKCKELTSLGGAIPAGEVDQFCEQNVYLRVSTNFGKDNCYDNFCSTGGTAILDPAAPRRDPENLAWTDFEGNASAMGNTLEFPVTEMGTGDFSAGAASVQLITEGDAWVEFEAGELDVSHVIGVRASCPDISLCPDEDATLGDIPLALSLNFDGPVYVLVNGEAVAQFDPYELGERFRIYVTDHHDDTADISFSRSCEPNLPCPAFYTHPLGAGFSYPLRVDATFREPNASLANVTIMRIIK